jgi:hypothetical protein
VLRLAADEDFDNRIVRGLVRKDENVDIVRVQDVGLSGADDPIVLEWAAGEGRVLFTHDVNTMPDHAKQRAKDGEPMPGLFIVPQGVAIGGTIDHMLLIAECSLEGEWEGQVLYLPLR